MIEITAENIDFAYGTKQILKNVSVKAEDGKFIGVIGANGSGKSTLLKCIYKVLKPNGGCVYINNENALTMPAKQCAKKMAVVAQQNRCDFEFSVKDVVLMGRSPHKKMMEQDNPEDFKIVDESLKAVGMLSMKDRSYSSLSGGEMQRVILARALAQQSEALILDEPTNHLDIKYQLELLEAVKKAKRTVIFAVHDLNIAAMYCDYIYVLDKGTVVAEGYPEEVLTPKIIKEVYEVDVKIYKDENRMHILYTR